MTVKNSIYKQATPRRPLIASKSDGDIYEIQNESNSNIRVVVRVRPENLYERTSNHDPVVKIMGEHVLVFDPKDDDPTVEFYRGKPRTGLDILNKKKRDLRFAFDRVFDETCTNDLVYDHTAHLVVDGVLNGINCSVFAYGATGAGKTFTMAGTEECPGVMYQAMSDLYDRIDSIKEEKICEVVVSYLEVYNETVRDLLSPKHQQGLPVREDPINGVQIVGLSYKKPDCMETVMDLLLRGNKNRSQHPTDANAESSRSHAVFQIFVKQRSRTAGTQVEYHNAKMSLIDLAGSERATVTKNRGCRFREGANINRSLLALGNVINALAEGKVRTQHIPYRDSKLTRILKDSIGGNCRTVMIANISPSSMTYEDTYNTLKYADRAKHIKAEVKSNVVSVDMHVHRYKAIIDDLRAEVAQLKKERDEGFCQMALTPRVSSTGLPIQEEIKSFKVAVANVFTKRISLRTEILDRDIEDKIQSLTLHTRKICLTRFPLISIDSNATDKTTAKLKRMMLSHLNRQKSLKERKAQDGKKMDENNAWLNRVEAEVCGKSSEMQDVVHEMIEQKHTEVELLESQRHVALLKKVARAQDRHIQSSEKIIKNLLQVARKQYLILKGSGLADPEVVEEFDQVHSLVGGGREVIWADEPSQTDSLDNFNLESVLDLPMACQTSSSSTPRKKRKSISNSTILTPSRRLTRVYKSPTEPTDGALLTDHTRGVRGTLYAKIPPTDEKKLRFNAGNTPMPKGPVLDLARHVSTPCQTLVAESASITNLTCDSELRKGESVGSDIVYQVAKTGVLTATGPQGAAEKATVITRTPGDKVKYSDSAALNDTFTLNSNTARSPLPSPPGNVDIIPGIGKTVTKLPTCNTSTGFDISCTPPSGQRRGIVRVMDFSGSQSPGLMSYADAVRSPPSLTVGMSKNAICFTSLVSPSSGVQPLPITPDLQRNITSSETDLLPAPKLNLTELYKTQSTEGINSPFGLAMRVASPCVKNMATRVPLKDTKSNHNIQANAEQDTWQTVTPKKPKLEQKNVNKNACALTGAGQNGKRFGYRGTHKNTIYQGKKAQHDKNIAVLKQAGLPSMRTLPGYMQLTAAAQTKRKYHDRTVSLAKENELPSGNVRPSSQLSGKLRTQSGPVATRKLPNPKPSWQ